MAEKAKEKEFAKVQKALDDALWNLKGTKDPEFRRAFLRQISSLLKEAHRILESGDAK